MRPYLRKYHLNWRRRGEDSLWERTRDFLKPFVRDVRAIWTANPPFPLTVKMVLTVGVLLLLVLPLLYFVLVPLSTLLALQVVLGPDLCPYDLIGNNTVDWIMTTHLDASQREMFIYTVQDMMRKTTVKLSLLIASYDYILTIRALGLPIHQEP